MLIHMGHSEIGGLKLVSSPFKSSDTPVEYKLSPPRLGEHTEQVLKELFGYSSERLISLKGRGMIYILAKGFKALQGFSSRGPS